MAKDVESEKAQTEERRKDTRVIIGLLFASLVLVVVGGFLPEEAALRLRMVASVAVNMAFLFDPSDSLFDSRGADAGTRSGPGLGRFSEVESMSKKKEEGEREYLRQRRSMNAFFILGALVVFVGLFFPFEAAQRLHIVSAVAFFTAFLLKPAHCTCQ